MSVYKIFQKVGFNDAELYGDGMFAELRSTAEMLVDCKAASPAGAVLLAVDEAQQLLRRLEAVAQEIKNETSG